MTPEEKINYALSLEADKAFGVRSPRIDALIPAALRLALAVHEWRERATPASWTAILVEHDAFLALLPEPPKEGA